jgi:uncharacterized protein DUF4411
MARIYLLDTSSFLDLKRYYPRDRLGVLWEKLEELAEEGRFITPREVVRELEGPADEIHAWAETVPSIIELDNEQAAALREVQTRFPKMADPSKLGPHADPICVALGLVRTRKGEDCYVINEEKDTVTASEKIPYVCRAFGVKWARVLQVPELEGLQFYLG